MAKGRTRLVGEQAHFELEGWDEFMKSVQGMVDDTAKRKEVIKILKREAKPTLNKAMDLAPIEKNNRTINRTVQGENGMRQYADTYKPGNLKKSHTMRAIPKSDSINPFVWVGPLAGGRGSSKKNRADRGYEFKDDGYYGFFLIRGTKHIKPMKNWIHQAFHQVGAASKTNKALTKFLIKNAKKNGLNAK